MSFQCAMLIDLAKVIAIEVSFSCIKIHIKFFAECKKFSAILLTRHEFEHVYLNFKFLKLETDIYF